MLYIYFLEKTFIKVIEMRRNNNNPILGLLYLKHFFTLHSDCKVGPPIPDHLSAPGENGEQFWAMDIFGM